MTDPNPLLFPSEPENSRPTSPENKHQRFFPSFDNSGESSWTQLLQAVLVSFAWFFDAQQAFISVFTDAEPKWSCNYSNSTSISSCNSKSNLCKLPSEAWSWDLPETTSIISEWSLQCSGSIVTGLPASSFFLGGLIGGFALSPLGDSNLGRKNLLTLASLVMSISGVLTAFSTSVWMYSGFRFVSGFGRSTIGVCALVLSTELVGKRWREYMGIIGFIFFSMGFMSLPGVAFLLRGSSWRLIYRWTCIPSIFYSCLLFFLVPESPRLLFLRARKKELAERTSQWDERPVQETSGIFSAMKILLKTGWAFRRLVSVMAAGLGIGMIYYGMPLGLGNLSFDLYLSVTLNALSEFPASLLTFLLIGKLDRKISMIGLTFLSGTCSIACVLVRWKSMQVVLELLAFFSACTAFDILLIYALELFPTCVRNSASGLVRQAVVFGAIFSPMLVAAGRKKGLVLSYGVFGVTILVSGLFVGCLPETRGRILCDTMEEEESQGHVNT